MDIVVTIPKKRMAQVEAEEKKVAEQAVRGIKVNFFWGLGKKPSSLEVGDRCYFVWNKAVRAYHDVVGTGKDMRCEMTGIVYPGFCLVLAPEIHKVSAIPMDGFQGFRYIDYRKIEHQWLVATGELRRARTPTG